NGKLVQAWCQAADRWPDFPGSWGADGRWKFCSAQTMFEANSPSFMATSIVRFRTQNWMLLSTRQRCAFASFDKQAIAETKNFVDLASLPPVAEIAPEWEACMASIARPAAQARLRTLMERGFHKPGDVENRAGIPRWSAR